MIINKFIVIIVMNVILLKMNVQEIIIFNWLTYILWVTWVIVQRKYFVFITLYILSYNLNSFISIIVYFMQS